jgi:hypothetical protein
MSWSRRLIAGASAALLAASLLAVTGASAADNRLAYVGSPPAPSTPPPPTATGLLTFTQVTAGGSTNVDYVVHSYDNQNLTHAFLKLPSTTVAQPDGLTVVTVYGTDKDSCSWVKGGTTVSCDFQKLTPKKPDRSISVVWAVSPSFDTGRTPVFTASLQVNEETNPNGTNAQVFQADSRTTPVEAGNANVTDTFLPPGQVDKQTFNTASLDTAGAGSLQTIVTVPAGQTGRAQVKDLNTTIDPFVCPSGYVCQNDYASASVNSGANVTPFVEWTLNAVVPSTYKLQQAFVAHYKDNGDLDVLLLNKQKDACTTLTKVPCATFTQVGNVVTIYVRTKANGGMRY